MAELIHVFHTPVSHGGRRWAVEAWGEGRQDGLWEAWLVFTAADGTPSLATERETTQSNRQAVEYWVCGLAPTYLEGAFQRAIGHAA
jgi:hypothetical protein